MNLEQLSPKKSTIKNVASQKKYVDGCQLESIFDHEPININRKVAIKTSRIFLVTVAANLSAIAIGTCFSWSSPIGPKLRSQDTTDSPLSRPITVSENAWISSIFTIGALITPFIAGPCADKIGRKKVLLFSSLFFILGYTFLLSATEVWVLLAGRLTLGFGCGFALSTIPVYVGEISTNQLRGATVAFMPLLMCFGVCYGYFIGPYVSYKALQYFCLFVPILFDIAFIFVPESPYYLVAQGQREAASKALQFLRGQSTQQVERELMSIEYLIKNSIAQKAALIEIVKTPDSRRALIISFGLSFFQQASGQSAVVFYVQTIFESAHIYVEGPVAGMIIGTAQLITAGIAPIVVDRFGRKIILLYSTVFMGISQVALGYFFFSQIVFRDTTGITWLPVAALIISNIAFMLGLGPVPWAVLSEIFPPSTKAFAAAMNIAFNWLTGFFVELFFLFLCELGTFYAFWLFAIFCILAFLFVLFIVPETKDLSFADIYFKLNQNL